MALLATQALQERQAGPASPELTDRLADKVKLVEMVVMELLVYQEKPDIH